MRDLFPAGSTLPVWPVTEDGRCGCGWSKCRRPGKHADERAPEGQAFAVITGARSCIVVIDIDTKKDDGFAQFESLPGFDGWPNTLTVTTPSGGVHLYFRHPGVHVGNGKLAGRSAIDVRGDEANDGGMAYVIGPGSPGYVKTDDPCVVRPAEPYEIEEGTEEIASAPGWLLAALLLGPSQKRGAFSPTPIDVDTPEGERRIELGRQACLEMPPSQADGQGGTRLLNVALRLVRALELPVEVAGALIVEYFNPRCTQADGTTPFPWSEDEILHKLEDARDKSDIPCGLPPEGIRDVIKEHAKPPVLRGISEITNKKPRKVHDPAHEYTYEPGEMMASTKPDAPSFTALVFALSRGHEWDGCWQYDEFAQRIVCIDPPIRLDAESAGLSDRDLANIRSVLEFQGMKVLKEDLYAAILAASSGVKFHPVREYLSALSSSSDTSILDGLAERLFGSPDPMANTFLRKFLISAVRRVLSPGCKVDTMLVLYGKQGFKKSTCLEVLFGSRYFKDDLADLESKDAAIGLVGRWLIEVAELDKILRAETSTVKAFLSRRVDRYRPPYGKQEIDVPRQCVFVGTTNEQEFQRDHTGGRRFWPVHVAKRVNVEWLEANRDAIWAAAHALALAGEPHWLSDADESQADVVREAYTEFDSYHAAIEAACMGQEWVRAETIYSDVLNKGSSGGLLGFDRKTLLKITTSLTRLGCQKTMVYDKGLRVRAWLVPERLRSAEAPRTMAKVVALHGKK